MFATYGQGWIFLYFAFVGVLCGVIYEAGFLVRFCCRQNKIIVFAVDLAVCLACAALIIAALFYGQVQLRWFVFAAVVAGIIIERISLGFLIAKTAERIYNVGVKLAGYLKRALKLRRQRQRTP